MKKAIRITLYIISGLIGLVVIAAILIPILFKDDIQRAIDSELDKSLNATVFYDVDNFSLSLFRSFPNISVQMRDFGIKGEGVFESDTLAAVNNFELTVDLSSLFGEIAINKIQLDDPKILVLVLADGSANYDIAAASEEEEPEVESESSESAEFAIKIDRWEINNAEVVYYDQSLDFYTAISGLTHSGYGNFSLDVFKMVTETTIESLSLGYEGTEYLSNKSVFADITMNMDMANMRFDFLENRVRVNDFPIGFEGFISMPSDDIEMDITYSGKDIQMKSVLSLIPGAYEEYLEGISASGEISFDGIVKGTYNETSMPQVKATLKIADGKISTSDTPAPLEQIQTTLTFDYPSADLAETSVDLNFSGQMSGQKTTLILAFENLDDYQWEVDFRADMDLEQMAKILPLEGTELRGEMKVVLFTKGKMSDVEAERWEKLPTSGRFEANDFYFKGPDLPQGFGMESVDAEFDPSKIELGSFRATAGRSDFSLQGKLTNYLAFALGKDETLVGNLNLNSNFIDADEWMTEEEEDIEEVETVDTTALEVVRIPKNIDFTFQSAISSIKYTNLNLKDFKGEVVVREGSVILDHSGFTLLNGEFVMTGEYASAPEKPTFNFDFEIVDLSIPAAFQAFTPIQKLVPVAEKTTGDFSTSFKASGALGSDMMPIMSSLSGSGLIEIAEAAVQNIKVLDGIKKVANLKLADGNSENLANLKDVALSESISDGRFSVKPF
ncbi:MAG: AsmA-like C-terminal region-containing protein [Cyclobacteriaceae bacterium]